MRHKEKCEWLEVVGLVSRSGSGSMKGKGEEKEVAMSPRASKKKKHIKKSAVKVVDSDIKIITKPSDVSGSRCSHALLECMDCLILAVENLTEAQWYMASACTASRMAVGALVDECNFLGFEGGAWGRRMKRRTWTWRQLTRRRSNRRLPSSGRKSWSPGLQTTRCSLTGLFFL